MKQGKKNEALDILDYAVVIGRLSKGWFSLSMYGRPIKKIKERMLYY